MATSSKTRVNARTNGRTRTAAVNTNVDVPTYKVETVTPAKAELWLEQNTHNVALRARIVDRYARDMESGNWVMRGDAIEFASDGTLLNGQHRLHAIVKSGATVAMLIGRNVPKEAQDVADSGRARTVADQLGLRGGKNPHVVAAIARRGWLWDNGYKPGTGNNVSPTHTECFAWIEANPESEEAAALAHTLAKSIGLAPSLTGFAFILFQRESYKDAVEYMARLADGSGLEIGSPILAMRNRVIREKSSGGRLTSEEWLYLLVSTWNAFREGRTITKLQLPRSDSQVGFPDPV